MKKHFTQNFLPAGLAIVQALIVLASCREFIEPSLNGKKVVLLAPAQGTETGSYSQTFWWEPVDGATAYRVQIVSPSFDTVSRLVADTLVRKEQFTTTLEPGRYQWRVRAENGSTQSGYSSSILTIRYSSISNQSVRLKSPADNLLTNLADITFSWEKMFAASRYRLQVDTNNFENENTLVLNNTTTGADYSFTFPKDKLFRWRVKAENDTAKSQWSSVYRVTADRTPPVAASLAAPANKASVARPVTLSWGTVESAKRYELLVLKSDSATVASASFPATLTTTSYSFNLGDLSEKFFWTVRAVDEAGNKGAYATVRSFTIGQ